MNVPLLAILLELLAIYRSSKWGEPTAGAYEDLTSLPRKRPWRCWRRSWSVIVVWRTRSSCPWSMTMRFQPLATPRTIGVAGCFLEILGDPSIPSALLAVLPPAGLPGCGAGGGSTFVAAVEAPTKKQAKKKAALMAISNLARATESQSQEVSPRSAGTEESWQMLEDYEMVEAAIGGGRWKLRWVSTCNISSTEWMVLAI